MSDPFLIAHDGSLFEIHTAWPSLRMGPQPPPRPAPRAQAYTDWKANDRSSSEPEDRDDGRQDSSMRRSIATFGPGTGLVVPSHVSGPGHQTHSRGRPTSGCTLPREGKSSRSSDCFGQHTFDAADGHACRSTADALRVDEDDEGNYDASLSRDNLSIFTNTTSGNTSSSSCATSIRSSQTPFVKSLDASLGSVKLQSGPGHLATAFGIIPATKPCPITDFPPLNRASRWLDSAERKAMLDSPIQLKKARARRASHGHFSASTTSDDDSDSSGAVSTASIGQIHSPQVLTRVNMLRTTSRRRRRAGMLITASMLDTRSDPLIFPTATPSKSSVRSSASSARFEASSPTRRAPGRAARLALGPIDIAAQRQTWLERHEPLLRLSRTYRENAQMGDTSVESYDALDTSQSCAAVQAQSATPFESRVTAPPVATRLRNRLRWIPAPLNLAVAGFASRKLATQSEQGSASNRSTTTKPGPRDVDAQATGVHFNMISSPSLTLERQLDAVPSAFLPRSRSAFAQVASAAGTTPSSGSTPFAAVSNSARSVQAILAEQSKQMQAFSRRVLRTPYPATKDSDTEGDESASPLIATPIRRGSSPEARRAAKTQINRSPSLNRIMPLPPSLAHSRYLAAHTVAGAVEQQASAVAAPLRSSSPDPAFGFSDPDVSTTAKIDALLHQLRVES